MITFLFFWFALWPIGRLSVLPYLLVNYPDNIQYFSLNYFFMKNRSLIKDECEFGCGNDR